MTENRKFHNPFIEGFLSFSKEELLSIIKDYEQKLRNSVDDIDKHSMFSLKLNAARVASTICSV